MFQPAMKTFYDANGYLVVPSVFKPSEFAGIHHRVQEFISDPQKAPEGVSIGREGDTVKDKTSPEARNTSIRALAFIVRFDPIFRTFAKQTLLLDLVRGLIGARIKVFRDQLLLKPPGG